MLTLIVLIIHKHYRKMLVKTLKAHGHTSEEAEDGLVAFGMVKEKGFAAFDAILMDFVMVKLRNFSFAFPPFFFPPFPLPLHRHICMHVCLSDCFFLITYLFSFFIFMSSYFSR